MAKRVKLPKRMWRRDKPWSKLSGSYADGQFEQIFGHEHELNIIDSRTEQEGRNGENKARMDS